jgi:hypothetical protein
MFFFRHPKPVSGSKEIPVLVRQNKASVQGQELVLVAKKTPDPDSENPMQKGDTKPPPA